MVQGPRPGLTLNGLATTAAPDRRQDLLDVISRLDTVTRDIRATVFDLPHPDGDQL
jgi:hypothetical protein